MIGYLNAIKSRDLLSTTRDGVSERGPRRTDSTTAIMPRLPSEYEPWKGPAFDLSAAEKGVTDEIEQTITSPTSETAAVRAQPRRQPEVNPAAEPRASQPESAVPLTRAVDPRLKTGDESPSIVAQPAPRAELPAEKMVPLTSERRHENVVVHAISKTPDGIAKTESESPLRNDHRFATGADRTRAVSRSPLIVPQIHESVPLTSRYKNGDSHAGQQRESSTAQNSEPSIVVTIGRIEVRAVTTASQSRSRPERQPLMSLDDYLNQRIRGVR
jgi:hypothetical protein